MAARVPVEFAPGGQVAWVPAGTTVLEASRLAGVPVNAQCGGRGVCGTCGVRVRAGSLAEPDSDERAALRRAPEGVRLACRARVAGPVSVKPVVASQLHAAGPLKNPEPVVVAVDLGTTNVSAVAIEARSGREVGRATVPNDQRSFGGDVLSRVSAALDGQRDGLRRAAEESVLAAVSASCDTGSIERLVIAGNTVMTALLAGADVSGLAVAPFRPPEDMALSADSLLGGALPSAASIALVPPIAAFVGGDVLAGIAGLMQDDGSQPSLLVDIGTNAEVAVVCGGEITVASAPAGPSFEGVGFSSGGPAVPGAIVSAVVRGSELAVSTIGGEPPLWLSGAGLVSVIAELVRVGHIAPDGVMVPVGPLAANFSRDELGVVGVRVGEVTSPVWLSQLDVRSFQLAKGAVRVAVEAALKASSVAAGSLTRLWVAGAFGGALSVADIVELGIVPVSAADVIDLPGNTSLSGAVSLALDENAFVDVLRLARTASAVELAADPAFGERLLEALSLEPYDS